MSPDMISIFCDLFFEVIDAFEGSIGTYTVHQFDMNGLSVNISVKIENMHLKDSERLVWFVCFV